VNASQLPLCRYVLKLRQELEEFTADIFAGAAEREQIRSVLADLAKTSGDFRQLAGWALASLAAALLNRLRCRPLAPLKAVLEQPRPGRVGTQYSRSLVEEHSPMVLAAQTVFYLQSCSFM